VDSIAAISARIAEIQAPLAAMTSRPATPTLSGGAFASTLADAVTRQAASASGAPALSSGTGVGLDTTSLPVQRIGAYGPAQLANAAAIIHAGQVAGMSVRDQTIGVMTAIGESSLTVVDHGDTAGPDSRGLFQQRANGAWGSLADRMDPTTSATSFFKALSGVGGRDSMDPTLVAHAVQRNADPQYYAKYWQSAVAIVTQLTGSSASGSTGG
jgi:hypothetical protein